MKQSRAMSLVESIANVAVGYGVAVVTQILIFPVFGLHTTLAQNLQMGAVFTVVSIARSFALRRLFEAIRVASENRCPRQAEDRQSVSKLSLSHSDPMVSRSRGWAARTSSRPGNMDRG